MSKVGKYCVSFTCENDGKECRAGWTNCGIVIKGAGLKSGRGSLEKDLQGCNSLRKECDLWRDVRVERYVEISVLMDVLAEKIQKCTVEEQVTHVKNFIEKFEE